MLFISIDEALAGLSSYNIFNNKDLKPDIIKQDLSKIFKVNKTNGVEKIVLDDNYYRNDKETLTKSGSFGSSTNALIFGSIGGSSTSKSGSFDNMLMTKNVNDQLKVLNNYAQNDVQFERRGEMIVPKSLRVSRMMRASFSKNIFLSRVKRVYKDAQSVKEFILSTSHQEQEDQYGDDEATVSARNRDADLYGPSALGRLVDSLSGKLDTWKGVYENVTSQANGSKFRVCLANRGHRQTCSNGFTSLLSPSVKATIRADKSPRIDFGIMI